MPDLQDPSWALKTVKRGSRRGNLLVRVGSLGGDTAVLNDVSEAEVHEASVAAVVALLSGAVDELLLGKGDEIASLLEVSALGGTSGREGPAGAALALVLDWSDVTLSSPVDGVWVGLAAGGWHWLAVRVGLGAVSKSVVLNPLLVGEISPLVHLDGEGLLAGESLDVVLHDKLSRDEPVLESTHLVTLGLVRLVDLDLPFLELLEVRVLKGEGGGGGGEGSEQLHLENYASLNVMGVFTFSIE